MSNLYVHEDVTLTCSSGFHVSKMLVKDRGVRIAEGKLIATYEDKPKNFACKWAGVLAAIIAGMCIAAPFIIAVLAAFVIGMAVALTIGDLLCWVALRGATWAPVHSKVKIKGIHPLLSDSLLTCPVFGGEIKFFYDAATANKQNYINQFNNTVEILGAAFMGRSFRMLANSIYLIGWINASTSFGIGIVKSLAWGYGMAGVNGVISNEMVGNDATEGLDELTPKWSKDYLLANYQKPFTDPLYGEGETESAVKGDRLIGAGSQTGKMADNEGRFNNFGKQQAELFKTSNPVHRYSRGKNSPFYGRQLGRQQKLNSKAKQIGEEKTNELSGRYEKRASKEYAKGISKADYGILAGFWVADLISQYEKKSFNKFGMNDEEQARKNINIIANEH